MSSPAFAIPPDLSRDTGIWPGDGPIRIGSEEHKRLFCKTLLDTHDPYRPKVLDRPRLGEEAEKRITSLPIWDIAVQTNGFEERRHRHVLANLVEAYGIKLAPEPAYPRPKDPEWAFMVTGYSECIDSFFAFGLFETAKTSGFFPAELVDTFEPVVQEEGRHILFFVNWMAWHRRNMPLWRRPWFELKVAAVWIFLIYERIGIASDVTHGQQDNNFTMNGASQLGGDDIDIYKLVDTCLREDSRRLGIYDKRLKRPRFVPFMMRTFRRFFGPRPAAAAT